MLHRRRIGLESAGGRYHRRQPGSHDHCLTETLPDRLN
jgi:hypothetical protein